MYYAYVRVPQRISSSHANLSHFRNPLLFGAELKDTFRSLGKCCFQRWIKIYVSYVPKLFKTRSFLLLLGRQLLSTIRTEISATILSAIISVSDCQWSCESLSFANIRRSILIRFRIISPSSWYYYDMYNAVPAFVALWWYYTGRPNKSEKCLQ